MILAYPSHQTNLISTHWRLLSNRPHFLNHFQEARGTPLICPRSSGSPCLINWKFKHILPIYTVLCEHNRANRKLSSYDNLVLIMPFKCLSNPLNTGAQVLWWIWNLKLSRLNEFKSSHRPPLITQAFEELYKNILRYSKFYYLR